MYITMFRSEQDGNLLQFEWRHSNPLSECDPALCLLLAMYLVQEDAHVSPGSANVCGAAHVFALS
jgi:hypothetical protein